MTKQKRNLIPLTKAGQKARQPRKKPSIDDRIKQMHAFIVAYMHSVSENNINDDLSVVSTAFSKVLYGMGMAMNKKDKSKTREFMLEVLDSIREQVAADKELQDAKDEQEQKPENEPEGNEPAKEEA